MSDLIKQIEELNLRCDSSTLLPVILQVEQLLKERDEARREVCEMPPRTYIKQAYAYAYLRGWDCFKEEEMACDTLSQEVSQEGSKLPTTISSNGICITEYIPPQNSVREIPPYGAYTTGECTLSVHNKEEKL